MEDIPICECATFWETHHDECPVRREVESLRAELAEAKQDAERYRTLIADMWVWGSVQPKMGDGQIPAVSLWITGTVPMDKAGVDETIDAAMAGGENGN